MNEHNSIPSANVSEPQGYLDMVRALAMFGSEDGMRPIMEMAIQRLDEEIGAIARSLRANDTATASHLLHGIKGFAPIFCSDQLAEQIGEVERLSKTVTAPQVAVAYDALAPALTRLRDEMNAYLNPPV
jgi:HPt (histidine-containing phosphotransfer) domain-containing protein